MSNTTIHTSTTTSRIGLLSAPSTAYIITVILIGIIVVILMYFCINDHTRHIMIKCSYFLFLLIIKIILFVPALLVLLYCYSYKTFVFIAKKFKKKSQIDVVLHTIVIINNTDSTTDTNIDKISYTINFILKCYSCS
jgi:hypothetical protein